MSSDDLVAIETEEGATYTHWTDGYAVGFHVTAPDKPDRWVLLNPSQSDSLAESNVFVYLEDSEPTTEQPHLQTVCYVPIWGEDEMATVTPELSARLGELTRDEHDALEETAHEVASQQASSAINSGEEAGFLLAAGWTEDQIRKLLDEA
jgi:hypothetical protein